MSEENRQLQDLVAVHGFYVGLIEIALAHAVPLPQEAVQAAADREHMESSIAVLQRWLDLLDMAINPPMVRDALKDATTDQTAEALLRYYIQKGSAKENDRDKTDFVATFLYRRMAGAQKQEDRSQDFAKQLESTLAGIPVPELPKERAQLIGEFEFIRQEVEDIRHFDKLMDSGISQRVREIKLSLQQSFYHPRALATISAYNAFFGARFDELFHQAAQHIKSFAAQAQQQGTSIMSKVDEDVTFQHLEQVDDEVLNVEYGRAQEQFRKFSKFKKAVDKKMPAVRTAVIGGGGGGAAAAAAPSGLIVDVEEGKMRAVADSIRNFTRASDNKGGMVVPLPHGNCALTAAEAEAFRADFLQEKSFRADYARAMQRAVCLSNRMISEMRDYHAKRGSEYLWKPHADALAYLLASANRETENAGALIGLAQQRGLADKIAAMKATIDKLRGQCQNTAATLQTM
ncbi:MAG: hypothetical protein M3P27_03490 [Acidobacteriota bacterium]|nr:hypothetical protein [Acidobacteriota bacterium]